MTRRLHATALAPAFVSTRAPAAVDASSGRDERPGDRNNKAGRYRASIRTAAPVFSPNDRDVVASHYRNRTSNVPPGLEQRGGKSPPGPERRLERNGTLPRGLQKRIDPFPRGLDHQLPPLSPDYSRGFIGGSAAIVNRTSSTTYSTARAGRAFGLRLGKPERGSL